MNQLQIFKNELFEVAAKMKDGQVLFEIEQVAKSLGFTQTKNNKEYIRWETVNKYLNKYVSQDVGKGDYIPEPLVYKLAFKASNEIAEKFQDWLAIDVIPSIRKTGSYENPQPMSQSELALLQAQNMVALEKRVDEQGNKIENITEILKLTNNDWRNKVNKIINAIAQKLGGNQYYQEIRKESYELLEDRANCILNRRLDNRKSKMALRGSSKTVINKVSKLDVIEEDKKLISVYITVIKELAVKYQLDISEHQLVEQI